MRDLIAWLCFLLGLNKMIRTYVRQNGGAYESISKNKKSESYRLAQVQDNGDLLFLCFRDRRDQSLQVGISVMA